MKVKSKLWLEVDGHPLIGDGRYRLLLSVHNCGSINAAAKELGVSYRKVWAQLQSMEEISPFPLMERRAGGKNGGSTKLTTEALKLMQKFNEMRQRINDDADRCFEQYFSAGDFNV